MTHTLTLTSIAPVTHDTWHLTFDHPKGFQFEPGQATHWALDEDGWRDQSASEALNAYASVGWRGERKYGETRSHHGIAFGAVSSGFGKR